LFVIAIATIIIIIESSPTTSDTHLQIISIGHAAAAAASTKQVHKHSWPTAVW